MTESTELRQLVEDLPRRPIVPTSPGDPDQLEVIEVAKNQLLQLAKRAAIGELVSGVAHEINNPGLYTSSGAVCYNNQLGAA